MTLVVPKAINGMLNVEHRMDADRMGEYLTTKRRNQEVQLKLPKFKIEFKTKLKTNLRQVRTLIIYMQMLVYLQI
jgi:serine protease inhibitor